MPVTYIDLGEFQKQGYLQEANRLFFHPLGLALELVQDEGVWKLWGIWDERKDPEGVAFVGAPDVAKAANVEAARSALAVTRIEKFGWAIQPVGVSLPEEKI